MKISIVLVMVSLVFVGCSDDEASSGWRVTEGSGGETSYGDSSDVVVTAGGDTYVVTADGDTEGCADLGDGVCIDISEVEGRYCDKEGAQADIFVDENGEVIDVICYPPADGGTPVEELEPDAEGHIELAQNQNGTVLVFGEETNGEELKGDLNLEAERTILFGNGVDVTILAGNLKIASNTSRARGITVKGDVEFTSNSNKSSLAFCKVYGNLHVKSNNTAVANCQVFGNVKVESNGVTLTNIGVQGDWEVGGSTCNGCYSFADANEDFEIVAEDVGDAHECGGQ